MSETKLSQAEMQRLIDLSPAVHYVAKASGNYAAIYISDGVKAQLGYEPGQFTQDSDFWASHIHPDDRSRVFADLEGLSRNDRHVHEYRFLRADGGWRWMYDDLTLVRDEHGNPVEIIGSWLDITERQAAEQALRESEARTQALLNGNPDLIFSMDSEGRYLDFHAFDQTLLALPSEEIAGRKLSEFFDPDFVFASQQNIDKALETGEMQLWEYQLPIQGVNRDFEARFVRSGENEVIVTVRDITERADLEREIISMNERESNRMGRDLHDGVGQTLTGISLGLGMLSQTLVDEHSPHAPTAQHLARMVQNTIVEIKRVARRLSPVVSIELGACTALSALADEVNAYPNVTCHARCSHQADVRDPRVATHLYRIAQESINNALRHGHAQNIELSYRRDAELVRLEVLDDGIGIPAEGDRVEGVGLRNMRYRARMIDGSLNVTPRAEGGTRVLCSCILPAP